MSPKPSLPADKMTEPNNSDNPASSPLAQNFEGQSTKVAAVPAIQIESANENIGGAHDILKDLNVDIRSQEEQEREVTAKLAEAHKKAEDERDNKLIEKQTAKLDPLQRKRLNLEAQLEARGSSLQKRQKLREDIDSIQEQLKEIEADISVSQDRLKARELEHTAAQDGADVDYSMHPKPGETERQFLIRIGHITPFQMAKAQRRQQPQSALEEALRDAEDEDELKKQAEMVSAKPQSHQNLQKPGFMSSTTPDAERPIQKIDYSKIGAKKRPSTRTKDTEKATTEGARDDVAGPAPKESPRTPQYIADYDWGVPASTTGATIGGSAADTTSTSRRSTPAKFTPRKGRSKATTPDDSDASFVADAMVEDIDVDEEEDSFDSFDDEARDKRRKKASGKTKATKEENVVITDDGDEKAYQKRVDNWVQERNAVREQMETGEEEDNRPEWEKPCPTAKGHTMDGDVTIPGDIYGTLFNYQKVGVQWLSELYAQRMGGILADEMGLGKTIQVIAMIAALHHSGKLDKPVLIVCPATVMQQWVNEFHSWWPALRVSILHSSGAGMLNVKKEASYDDGYSRGAKPATKAQKAVKGIVNRVLQKGHVLVTTYQGLDTYSKLLIDVHWGYAVLDEGHKIKNPNANVTYACKSLTTHNRIILSGTPMQNNMVEIWSLMDFVHPGLLGTLEDFKIHFEEPIKRGGHKSCSNLERKIAEEIAGSLKTTIAEQFLQRFKVDVASDLPTKTEQTLCCRFTKLQAQKYREVLGSREVSKAKADGTSAMEAITMLTKCCNHPDLLDHSLKLQPSYNYGDPEKSGKMEVTKKLIEMWKAKGEKMLLFSQTVQMMDILEKFLTSLGTIRYMVMNGKTPMSQRTLMVSQFNTDSEIDVFLLSTRVGGLGLNLTGASGVIIFDPNWNPSVDAQARERVWRLGQKKAVSVFRLMCKGAIEEKMYQRQLYKTKLAEKVLRDNTASNLFDQADLQDLFSFDNDVVDAKPAEYTQGAERRIQASPSKDDKYNTDTVENGTTLEQHGMAQAKYAVNPKEYKARAAPVEGRKIKRKAAETDGPWRDSPPKGNCKAAELEDTWGNPMSSMKQKAAEINDAWGSPTPPYTSNGFSPDVPSPSAKRQKRAEAQDPDDDMWDTADQVKALPEVVTAYDTKYFNPEDEDKPVGDSETSHQKTLDSIFATSGIHSVLSHEAILAGKKEQLDPRYFAADVRTAKREAEDVLRRNKEKAKRQPAGVVTWTGRHGEAGRTVEREQVPRRSQWRLGGEHSLRSGESPNRNPAARAVGRSDRFGRGASISRQNTPMREAPAPQEPSKWQPLIRAFLKAHGGGAPMDVLRVHFESMTREPGQARELLEELKNMCEITNLQKGRKKWMLKAKYR